MKILITGAAGFIGSNLSNKCFELGHDVTGVDDMSNGHLDFLDKGVTCHQARFDHPVVLSGIRNQSYDVVVHLAARPRVSYSVEHPLETNDINVTSTLNLLDACKGNIKRFVFASSSSVYGGSALLPMTEQHTKNPQSPYALQKSIIEDYLKQWNIHYGMDSACLRFFNVFGPHSLGGTPYSTAINAWLTAIMKGESMRSDGDGLQTRDLCYVDNVVQACVLAAQHGSPLGAECFNVAAGERTSNIAILNELKRRFPGAKSHEAPERPGDVRHTLADITKIKSVLGYKDPVTVWEGLDKTVEWYTNNWNWIKNLKVTM